MKMFVSSRKPEDDCLTRYCAFLRGINVGGRNRLPMAELKQILENLGFEKVETVIQSGNVLYEAEGDGSRHHEMISEAIEEKTGFSPRVVVLSLDRLRAIISSNPFPEAVQEPSALHVFFLESAPEEPDVAQLSTIATARERFHLVSDTFWLHAPDGIGRSKLASSVERLLGVVATARNWRTIQRVMELADAR